MWNVDQPFQALALTGGGYRGLFTARALQEMEDHIGEPIGRHFDLTYGTSVNFHAKLTRHFHLKLTHPLA